MADGWEREWDAAKGLALAQAPPADLLPTTPRTLAKGAMGVTAGEGG